MLYSFFSVLRGKVSWTAALNLEYVYKKQISCAKNDNWITKFKKIS